MKYILAVLALGVLILVHELGHFIMAKINKVKVIEFSIGMGPKIFTYKGKETNYSISLLPIGGYVEMLGTHETIDEENSFSSKSPLRRISIVIAGVVMNFILAMGIFTAITMHSGYTDLSIKEVVADGAFAEAGIEAGSKILKINGEKVKLFEEASIEIGKGKEMDIQYKDANGEIKNTILKPKYDKKEKKYLVGVYFNLNKNPGVVDAFTHSCYQTKYLIEETVSTLVNLVTGKGNFKTDLGGPVTVVRLSAGAAEAGMWTLIYLVGLMSISLAVFNIVPFPFLDGGWAVLLLIELITRRKVPDKVVGVLNTIGFILIMGLMVAVTIKDIIFPASF